MRVHLREYFPRLLSYNRFVEIMPSVIAPLTLYIMKCRLGKSSGINFVDSTTLKVCDNHRIHSNRVFSEIAKRGKSSTGWFYGFKLHRAAFCPFFPSPCDILYHSLLQLSRVTAILEVAIETHSNSIIKKGYSNSTHLTISSITLRLSVKQLAIVSIFTKQFPVLALLQNATVFQHQYLIRRHNTGQAV